MIEFPTIFICKNVIGERSEPEKIALIAEF